MGFLNPYIDSGKISRECYDEVRKKLLLEFFVVWIVNKEMNDGKFLFSDEDLQGLVEAEYKKEAYYSEYKKRLMNMRIKYKINNLLGK